MLPVHELARPTAVPKLGSVSVPAPDAHLSCICAAAAPARLRIVERKQEFSGQGCRCEIIIRIGDSY